MRRTFTGHTRSFVQQPQGKPEPKSDELYIKYTVRPETVYTVRDIATVKDRRKPEPESTISRKDFVRSTQVKSCLYKKPPTMDSELLPEDEYHSQVKDIARRQLNAAIKSGNPQRILREIDAYSKHCNDKEIDDLKELKTYWRVGEIVA